MHCSIILRLGLQWSLNGRSKVQRLHAVVGKICPANSWSNADLAPQNERAMQTLPRTIKGTEFQGPKNQHKFIFSQVFLHWLINQLYFRIKRKTLGPLLGIKLLYGMVPLSSVSLLLLPSYLKPLVKLGLSLQYLPYMVRARKLKL